MKREISITKCQIRSVTNFLTTYQFLIIPNFTKISNNQYIKKNREIDIRSFKLQCSFCPKIIIRVETITKSITSPKKTKHHLMHLNKKDIFHVHHLKSQLHKDNLLGWKKRRRQNGMHKKKKKTKCAGSILVRPSYFFLIFIFNILIYDDKE